MLVVFIVFIIGACLGSFLCCQARRLYHKGSKHSKLPARSVCLHCKHQLKWYENIPIISWVLQKGKCRHCHKKIGLAELLSELATGVALVIILATFIFSASSSGLTIFGIFPEQIVTDSFSTIGVYNWLALLVTIILALTLIFLAIYDGLYGELPSFALIIAAVFAILLILVKFTTIINYQPALNTNTDFVLSLFSDTLLAIAILGGLYLILYLVSHGKWVGDGDWILGSIIAAALGTPWLALLALFLANLSATVVTFPAIKKRKNHKIFFGPFLVFAYTIVLALSNCDIINLW